MSDWVHIVLPIATLVLGSLLTMAGQAIRDRRMDERDRRARREGFLATNFEIHRSAMLEMQELVRDFYDAFFREKQRRETDGFYRYIESWPLGEIQKKIIYSVASAQEMTDAIINAPSDAERIELINSLTREAEAAQEKAEETRIEIGKMSNVLSGLYPFWKEFAQFVGKLRICMYRSGSNSVVNSGEAFIDAIYGWCDYYRSDRSQDELTEKVRTTRYELNRALSNALKYGPYDKYDSKKTNLYGAAC